MQDANHNYNRSLTMASLVSIGDCVDLATDIVRLYKFCHDAPKEMNAAVEKANYVSVRLRYYGSPRTRPEFLNDPNGRKLYVTISYISQEVY